MDSVFPPVIYTLTCPTCGGPRGELSTAPGFVNWQFPCCVPEPEPYQPTIEDQLIEALENIANDKIPECEGFHCGLGYRCDCAVTYARTILKALTGE